MKTAKFKIRKKIQVEVIASREQVRVKYPRQIIGTIALVFTNARRNILLKQFEIVFVRGHLSTREVK